MTVEGHIQNGQIVLDSAISLPEGMKVRVELLPTGGAAQEVEPTPDEESAELPSLYERMKPFIGAVKGLSSDFAMNQDHYLHGQPKRQ